MNPIELAKPPEKFLQQVLGQLGAKLDSMNMYEVVKHVYEATFYKYAILTLEERYLREKGEKKIIEKVGHEADYKEAILAMYTKLEKDPDNAFFLRKEIRPILKRLGFTFFNGPIGEKLPEESEGPPDGAA